MRRSLGTLLLASLFTAPVLAGGRGLDIIEAWYGVGDRVCDASWALQSQCGREGCEVYASNDLCGDPKRGREKALYVTYACGDRTRTKTIPEYAVGVLSCGRSRSYSPYRPAFERSPRRRHRGGLDILSATYGSRHRACDATGSALEFCGGGPECSVPVDNYLCGDPHKGVRKSLFVEFTCGGRVRQASAGEGGELYLSCH